MYVRKPNTECNICNKAIYRRPSYLSNTNGKAYCSKICYGLSCRKEFPCKICEKLILASKHSKICSRECANKARIGTKYEKGSGLKLFNDSAKCLHILKSLYNFTSCMVENCSYNKTYDIHRHITGKNGGKYEIGNMFAICPNHHAEVTRKIIILDKVNNFILRIVSGMDEDSGFKLPDE